MKKLSIFIVTLVLGAFVYHTNTGAQERGRHGGDKDDPRIEGEIEFQIGDTIIRIGGNERYDGRNHQSLERRVYQLERAVRFLLENQGYSSNRDRWECVIETPFNGMFVARSDTKTSAIAEVVNKCSEKASRIYCESDDADCEEIGRRR